MKKRIIVTGGAGYIGDSVVQILLQTGAEVTVFDSLMYGGAYMRPGVKFVRGDIETNQLVNLIRKDKPDAVVHLAAIVGDGACQVNPDITIAVNEFATKKLAKVCGSMGVRLVFASTCSVYGSNDDLLNEDSPTNPLSLYAGTKLNAEKGVRERCPDHIIFRLGTLFGMSTEHARIRCDLVANILTYKGIQGQAITVFGGEQWRPLLHVRDAGLMFARAALGSGVPGTYIISRENTKICDLADKIRQWTGAKIFKTKAKFEDLRNYRVDTTKAAKEGFNPTKSLDDGISEMVRVLSEGRIADVWSPEFHNAKYVGDKYANS